MLSADTGDGRRLIDSCIASPIQMPSKGAISKDKEAWFARMRRYGDWLLRQNRARSSLQDFAQNRAIAR